MPLQTYPESECNTMFITRCESSIKPILLVHAFKRNITVRELGQESTLYNHRITLTVTLAASHSRLIPACICFRWTASKKKLGISSIPHLLLKFMSCSILVYTREKSGVDLDFTSLYMDIIRSGAISDSFDKNVHQDSSDTMFNKIFVQQWTRL